MPFGFVSMALWKLLAIWLLSVEVEVYIFKVTPRLVASALAPQATLVQNGSEVFARTPARVIDRPPVDEPRWAFPGLLLLHPLSSTAATERVAKAVVVSGVFMTTPVRVGTEGRSPTSGCAPFCRDAIGEDCQEQDAADDDELPVGLNPGDDQAGLQDHG